MRTTILLILVLALTGCSGSGSQLVLEALQENNVEPVTPGSLRPIIEPAIRSNIPPVAIWRFIPENRPGEECLAFLELTEQAGQLTYDQIHEVDATCYEVVHEVPGEFRSGWNFMEKCWVASDGTTYTAIFGPVWQEDFSTIEATWRDDFVSSADVSNGAFLIIRPGMADLRFLIAYKIDGARLEQFDVPVWP